MERCRGRRKGSTRDGYLPHMGDREATRAGMGCRMRTPRHVIEENRGGGVGTQRSVYQNGPNQCFLL